MSLRRLVILGLGLALGVGACGGGGGSGGGGSSGSGVGFPSLPGIGGAPPLLASQFETAEYDASFGLRAIGASSAYAWQVTGAGAIVAVIDTGIDGAHAELQGAVHPDSIDIVTGSGDHLADGSGHGTAVAGVVAARRNDQLSHGVAFEADILAIRADAPGSCPDACVFLDTDLAAATLYAVEQGARVINYSLGGSGSLSPTFQQALEQAVAAGVVLVFAAGNDGAANPAMPASFAATAGAGGQGIAVGAVGADLEIAGFSNRAGSARNAYLVAPGVGIVVPDAGGGGALATGTSFAAPHVAGAAALLLGAWPHLSAEFVVQILLASAADLGAAGTDAVYGRGLLDLAAAFTPSGSLSVPAGDEATGASAALEATGLRLGHAFGPTLRREPLLASAIAVDGYGRDFGVDLAARVTPAGHGRLLERRLLRDPLTVVEQPFGDGGIALAFRPDEARPAERPPARGDELRRFAVSQEIAPATRLRLGRGLVQGSRLGFATGAGAPELLGRDAFASPFLAFVEDGDGLRLDRELGAGIGLGLAVLHDRTEGRARPRQDTVAVELQRAGPRGGLGLQLGMLRERAGLLDSRADGAFALGDRALTRFLSLGGRLRLDATTTLGGHASLGRTEAPAAPGTLLRPSGTLTSASFGLGLVREEIIAGGDRLGVALTRPLRIERGSALLDLPTGRAADGAIERLRRRVSLAPSGQEVDLELAYGLPLAGGELALHGLLQLEPGHDALAPPILAFGLVFRRGW